MSPLFLFRPLCLHFISPHPPPYLQARIFVPLEPPFSFYLFFGAPLQWRLIWSTEADAIDASIERESGWKNTHTHTHENATCPLCHSQAEIITKLTYSAPSFDAPGIQKVPTITQHKHSQARARAHTLALTSPVPGSLLPASILSIISSFVLTTFFFFGFFQPLLADVKMP